MSDFHLDRFAGPRAFARWALTGQRLALSGGGCMRSVEQMHGHGAATELTLFRDGPWQITLVTLAPGSIVLPHKHRHVSSVDLAIGGGGTVSVGDVHGRRVSAMPSEYWLTQLQRIPANVAHGGMVGPDGGSFLSFQQWDCDPTYIADDWEWCHG